MNSAPHRGQWVSFSLLCGPEGDEAREPSMIVADGRVDEPDGAASAMSGSGIHKSVCGKCFVGIVNLSLPRQGS